MAVPLGDRKYLLGWHSFPFGIEIAGVNDGRESALLPWVGGLMTERRAARRYDLSLPIVIRVPIKRETSTKNGRTRDISTRGVYFILDQDVDAGTELDLTLTLPSEITRGTEVLVRAQGRVIRVDRHSDNDAKVVGVAAVIERYDIVRGDQSVS